MTFSEFDTIEQCFTDFFYVCSLQFDNNNGSGLLWKEI